jgi:hypothetical protein
MQSVIALFHFASKKQVVQLTIKHVWVVGAAPLKHDAGFKYFSYFCGVIKYDKGMTTMQFPTIKPTTQR